MRIKGWVAVFGMVAMPAMAADMEHMGHGSSLFHAFRLEMDSGVGRNDTVSTWDLQGWVGGDSEKLWLRSEGSLADGITKDAEFWAMYSRNIATFWDVQAGVRYDTDPRSTGYLVAGFKGLAPYHFDTEAHVFVSHEGDVSLRLREENDFLLTQRLIVQPYVEANFFAQRVREQGKGAGLAGGEIGVQTRYEITRKFAPYVDVRWEQDFGGTAALARRMGDTGHDLIASVGLRLMF